MLNINKKSYIFNYIIRLYNFNTIILDLKMYIINFFYKVKILIESKSINL